MVRKIDCDFPKVIPGGANPYTDSTKIEYTIGVITPLFGGGAEAGVNDGVTLIRPSSIRGHLRFWWRATRGAKCRDVRELRQREGEIWGTTENPSPVEMKVSVHSEGNSNVCAVWNLVEKNGNQDYKLKWNEPFEGKVLPYVLFPFQSDKEKRSPARYRDPGPSESASPRLRRASIEFSLILHISKAVKMAHRRGVYDKQRARLLLAPLHKNDDDIQKDIEAAVWAWVNFGGIGARTRRGCGALYCETTDPVDATFHPPSVIGFHDWLKERAQRYDFSTTSGLRPWPTFPSWIGLKQSRGYDAVQAWKEAVAVMQGFRQGQGIGRDRGRITPGQSRWPEAESVRRLVETQSGISSRPDGWHRNTRIPPNHFFPRAEFGMPIIFELLKEKVPNGKFHNLPNLKPTLQPGAEESRMASPIILRPIRFTDGNHAAMAAQFNTQPLSEAVLKPGERDLLKIVPIPGGQIRDPALATYADSPMTSRTASGSALEAFIAYLQEPTQGFTKVSP